MSSPADFTIENKGGKVLIRGYGGNVYSWKTSKGIEILGTRLDSGDIAADKPYSGGVPHYFPQVSAMY